VGPGAGFCCSHREAQFSTILQPAVLEMSSFASYLAREFNPEVPKSKDAAYLPRSPRPDMSKA
jgi:hypothetical protein